MHWPLPVPLVSRFWIVPPNTRPLVPWLPVPLIARTSPGLPTSMVTPPWAARPTLSGDSSVWPNTACRDSTCHAPASSTAPLTIRVPKNMPIDGLPGVDTRSVKK